MESYMELPTNYGIPDQYMDFGNPDWFEAQLNGESSYTPIADMEEAEPAA